jgi:hypothetical protein
VTTTLIDSLNTSSTALGALLGEHAAQLPEYEVARLASAVDALRNLTLVEVCIAAEARGSA